MGVSSNVAKDARRKTRLMVPLSAAVLTVAALLSTGCSDLLTASSVTTNLNVAMNGTSTVPDGAIGNNDPTYQLYTLKSITLTKSDGTSVAAYDGDPVELRIINRPQIISTYDMSKDAGTVFSAITITFDTTVTGAGRYQDNLSIGLTNPVLTYNQSFTVAKAQDRRLDILVNWQNTVTESDADETDSLQAPTFQLKLTPN